MEKATLIKVLEELRVDLNSAYHQSDSSEVDANLMRAYGRVDTLIKIVRE